MESDQTLAPRIYAHRGSSILAPENTQVAFDMALEHAADVLETDVRISADRHVIVTHDVTVDRTTDGRGKVRDMTLDELKKLDAGFRARDEMGHSFRARGIRLLTLDELFQHYPDIMINIDIKDNEPEAAQLVADAILRNNRENNVTVGSFHARVLLRFRLLAPTIRTAAVQHEVAQLFLQHLPLTKIRAEMNYSAVQIPTSWRMIPLSTARFIRHIQRHGKEVCYWTVNDVSVMRLLLSLGADGIITDRPDLALPLFRELGYKR